MAGIVRRAGSASRGVKRTTRKAAVRLSGCRMGPGTWIPFGRRRSRSPLRLLEEGAIGLLLLLNANAGALGDGGQGDIVGGRSQRGRLILRPGGREDGNITDQGQAKDQRGGCAPPGPDPRPSAQHEGSHHWRLFIARSTSDAFCRASAWPGSRARTRRYSRSARSLSPRAWNSCARVRASSMSLICWEVRGVRTPAPPPSSGRGVAGLATGGCRETPVSAAGGGGEGRPLARDPTALVHWPHCDYERGAGGAGRRRRRLRRL